MGIGGLSVIRSLDEQLPHCFASLVFGVVVANLTRGLVLQPHFVNKAVRIYQIFIRNQRQNMTLLFSAFSNSEGGSSPWARGTLSIRKSLMNSKRFIPVGTGNTTRHQHLHAGLTVHPRGHGEHRFRLLFIANHIRFIPVGTGNTQVEVTT